MKGENRQKKREPDVHRWVQRYVGARRIVRRNHDVAILLSGDAPT